MEIPSENMDIIDSGEENIDSNPLNENYEKVENEHQPEIEDSLLVPAIEIPVDEDEGIRLDLSRQSEQQKPYSCEVKGCNKSFTRRAHLSRHSRLHTGERPYACLIINCKTFFARSEQRNQHMIKVHPEFRSESCYICFRAYIDENDRIEHIRSHQIEQSFRCSVCSKEFEKASSLAGHMQIHSRSGSSGRRVHKCNTCQMEFGRFDHLIRHQTVHSGVKEFDCQKCGRLFTRADNRKKHEITCKGGSTSAECENGVDQCDDNENKTLLETDPLEIINVSSILEQDFEDIDTSSNAIDFFEDMKFFAENGGDDVGDGENDNNDSIMNGSASLLSDSSRMSQLEADFDLEKLGGIRQKVPRPKLTQEEIDTLTCSICSKSLAQKYHLVRHKITHLGDLKPYKCLTCNRTFSRREHLKPHLLTHKRQSEKLSKYEAKKSTKLPQFKPLLKSSPSTVKPAIGKLQTNSLRSQLLYRFKVFAIKLKQKNPSDYYEQCFDFMGNLFLSNLQSINSETFPSKRSSLTMATTTILPKMLQVKKVEGVKSSSLLSTNSTQIISGTKKIPKCTVCNRIFSRNEHLRRHMAIHSNSKPYTCTICTRVFSRSDHMVQHFRVHHPNVRPYKCRYTNCFERFDTYKEKLEHGKNCNMFFTTPSTSLITTKTETLSQQNGFDANDSRRMDEEGEESFHDRNFVSTSNNDEVVPNFQTHFIKTENECLDDGYDPIYGY